MVNPFTDTSSTDAIEAVTDTETYTSSPTKVVCDSLFERCALTLIFASCIIFVSGANSFIMTVIWKTPALQTPQYFLMCCYGLCDILYSVSTHSMALVALVLDMTDVQNWACKYRGTIGTGIFFASIHVLGAIAYERHYWFIHPLTYYSHFTKWRLLLLAVIPHTLGQGMSTLIEILAGRQYHTTILGCNAPNEDVVYLNPALAIMFYIPSAAMSLVCLIRLILLIKRQQKTISAQENMNTDNLANIHGMKRAIKIVMLVSGAFWMTSLPGFIARTAIFSAGVTWLDMDTGSNVIARIGLRIATVMMVTTSAMLNPFIYLAIHKELRRSCREVFRALCG